MHFWSLINFVFLSLDESMGLKYEQTKNELEIVVEKVIIKIGINSAETLKIASINILKVKSD